MWCCRWRRRRSHAGVQAFLNWCQQLRGVCVTSAGRGGRRCGWSGSKPYCPKSPSLLGSGLCWVLESNEHEGIKKHVCFYNPGISAILEHRGARTNNYTRECFNTCRHFRIRFKRDLANKVKKNWRDFVGKTDVTNLLPKKLLFVPQIFCLGRSSHPISISLYHLSDIWYQ